MNKKRILAWLNTNNLTLGSVESFTGGLFASSVVDIPGASSTFKGAIVSYSPDVKIKVVGVNPEIIKLYGVVSSKTAIEMALGGHRQLGVDYCISFTGNAGPGTLENKPVGDVYIGLSFKDQCIVEHFTFKGDRNEIREEAVNKGWEIIERVINEQNENYLLTGEE